MINKNLTRERIERAIELIEEQKEGADREYYLHDIGVSSSFDIEIYERVTGAFDTLLALANAELERQSVTDEDVAFAIEELEEVNNSLKLSRDGQRELGDEKEASGFDDWIFANELAIKVLKAYRTVIVTWENTDDCPMAICSGCGASLASYSWYDALVAGPESYCQYCGGKIVKEVRE
jgi:DNA-directed RNA polymerase subunit RPC12/RpoP